MRLYDFLNTISVFESVDYSRTGQTEVCLGRLSQGTSKGMNEKMMEVWLNMVSQTLIMQERKKADAVSFSKQYMVRDDSLIYLWKVVSKDTAWLEDNMPRLDKTLDWQNTAVSEVGLSEGPRGEVWGRVSLPGVKDKLEIGPKPEDYGFSSDAKDFNKA